MKKNFFEIIEDTDFLQQSHHAKEQINFTLWTVLVLKAVIMLSFTSV